jgi:hypothetical protein
MRLSQICNSGIVGGSAPGFPADLTGCYTSFGAIKTLPCGLARSNWVHDPCNDSAVLLKGI